VLALSRGGSPPPGADRRAALRGCDLVAVDVAPGSGVLGAWAAELAPTAVHAVRTGAGFGGDVERVARRLGGRSLGIVLSGGGARAFCHIGVLEELDAAGIVIDRVAGVSMGAYVGGMYAMGMDGDEMDAHCYDEWVRRRPLATTPSRGTRSSAATASRRCSSGCSGPWPSRSCRAGSSAPRRTCARASSWSAAPGRCGTRSA
jgi:hypothetical protein